ncbi:MAG: phosphoribosylformylglycinamidine synthase I [Candidatus Omnitrophica bacterium]|nr:phosphoribosylformylglycinamidine synthase I [Candidatus Omnitrophota bacterium]
MPKAKVLVLRTAGTNCDLETAYAFKKVGASCQLVHINRLVSGETKLDKYNILAIPGGFTYGDDIASGKILANEIRFKLKKDVTNFVKNGKLIIGICNGFQVLVKSGLLPNTSGTAGELQATLSINDSGKFEDRWVYLKTYKSQITNHKCVWTKGIGDVIYLPVAHAEGKFIPKDTATLSEMKKNGQIVFTYCGKKGERPGYPENPNGSVENVAGICDTGGRVFGLMPHPERHIRTTQHPRWTRIQKKKRSLDGLQIFKNGVKIASKL